MKRGVFGDMKNFSDSKVVKKLMTEATAKAAVRAKLLKGKPYADNLIPDSLDCFMPIYRIETLPHFLSNFEKNTLYFSHPKTWLSGDLLDSIILRKKVALPYREQVDNNYFEDTFCQCWSKKQSAKMWERYGKEPEYKNIMMASSVDKIMRALENPNSTSGYSDKFWAGEVLLDNFQDNGTSIVMKTVDDVKAFLDTRTIVSCYLEKRSSYFYEDDIRFIASACKMDKGKDFTRINLISNLRSVMDGLVLDPRMRPDLRKQVSQELSGMGLKIIEESKE